MYDNEPSQREREVNDSRHYFKINLCGTGASPGSADRQVSAHWYITDWATRPVGIYRTFTVFMSISFHFVWSQGTLELARCILLLIIKIDFQAGHNQSLNIDKQV